MTEPETGEEGGETDIPWPWVVAGLALVALVIVIFAFASGGNGTNEDRLSDTVAADEERATDPEQGCAARAIHEAIRGELFRRAAQLRGSDQETLQSIAGHTSVRMEAPIVTAQGDGRGTVSCRGLLWLDLPPGIVTTGSRQTLSGDLTYMVRTGSDGSRQLASLGNAEALVDPLSKLARLAEPEEDPLNVADPTAPLPGEELPSKYGPAEDLPSFDCAQVQTASEAAVCNDPGLAALDRQMAALYSRAFARADPGERALLEQTRDRFLAYREGCRTNTCIANAYQGRIREIRDIMAGQWQAPR